MLIALSFFLTVPWDGLWSVIVAFHGHTNLVLASKYSQVPDASYYKAVNSMLQAILFVVFQELRKNGLLTLLVFLLVYVYFVLTLGYGRFHIEHIRIYHELEGMIEKSVSRITVWQHKYCRVMTNGDPEGRIFLSYPHTNNGFFFLVTTVF